MSEIKIQKLETKMRTRCNILVTEISMYNLLGSTL